MRRAGQGGRRRPGLLARLAPLAGALLLTCAGGRPSTGALRVVAGSAGEVAPAAATPPQTQTQGQTQAPGTGFPPDRSRPPWSTTPIPLLAIGQVETGAAAGGTFWRIGTARGAVLAWRPASADAREAGVVVYLHGYFTTVDQAVADHRLLEQFSASGRAALFVAPEAPAWNGEESVWPDLAALLAEVLQRTGLARPRGPLVVAAHSGGYRTALLWLAEPRLEELLLLDGLYRGEAELLAWLDAAPSRRLVLVGDETAGKAEAMAAGVPGAVVLPRLPPARPGLDGAARAARLVAIRSQHPHMAIVERGEVLPLLLGATRLPAVR